MPPFIRAVIALALFFSSYLHAQESIWVEAEQLRGVRGHCFPDFNHKTAGHWAISGPGIAPEWTQGGESEWLSIACGPDDDQASASREVEVPESGEWALWVRYRDWRAQTELFVVRIEQPGQKAIDLTFGQRPVVDEEDELKLLWKWAFGWGRETIKLSKGRATITLLANQKQAGHRQVDCLCLTTDTTYRPRHREKPNHLTWQAIETIRSVPFVPASTAAISERWKVRTFRDRGFLYLWNMGKPWLDELGSTAVNRVTVPFHVDQPLIEEFRKVYGGKNDVPIFGDSRIVPTFLAAGPTILDDDNFVKWLDAHPNRPWANLVNYTTPTPLSEKARKNWEKYRDRYVGKIAGESLGVPTFDGKLLSEAVKNARSRGELAEGMRRTYTTGIAASERKIFGNDVTDPYRSTIACLSTEMTAYSHLCREWGAATVGYENTAVIPGLGMRMAFLRGGARQYDGSFATYRSCNFGDAATIYAKQGYFYPAQPQYAFDNQYDLWAGAGNTWYKLDIWHQYFSGAALFYHEQGHDEIWQPGGPSAGLKPLQLSPKGILVDQFLRLTREHPDRGVPYTPIAFLLDQAHGWEPNGYQPGAFGKAPAENPAVLTPGKHERMLKEWFKVAYHPYGPMESRVNTGVNQAFLPGVFGNVFDVLVTAPTRRDIVSAYPVLVISGEVTVSAEWSATLNDYMNRGGTVVVCDGQLSGPGATTLGLPKTGVEAESTRIDWGTRKVKSQRFRYRPIVGGESLARSENGDAIAARFARGKGQLLFFSVPMGLGLDESATPIVPLILEHVRRGLMPVEVHGNVEWMLNATANGWIITLLNPDGSNKPQHGVVPTDYSREQAVTIRLDQPAKSAMEWFTKESLTVSEKVVRITVPAGGARIVEVRR